METVINILQTVLDVLNWLAVHIPWDAVIASGFLSPLLVGVKKWFSVQSERVMISIVTGAAMLTAAIHYILSTPTQDPSIIAVQGAILAFMTQPIYFFVVKPLIRWFQARIAEAAALLVEEEKSKNLISDVNPPISPVNHPSPTPVTQPAIAQVSPQVAKYNDFTH